METRGEGVAGQTSSFGAGSDSVTCTTAEFCRREPPAGSSVPCDQRGETGADVIPVHRTFGRDHGGGRVCHLEG